MKIGDILVYAFTYNASYPHFVRVTRMTKSFIWVENVPKKWYQDDGYGQNGLVVPDFSKPTTPENGRFKIKQSKYDGNDYVVIKGCFARVWDGTPQDEYTD